MHAHLHGALYGGINVDDVLAYRSESYKEVVGCFCRPKKSGFVERLYTFNYDNILEMYLRKSGYDVQVRTGGNELSTNSDVEIIHLHGYLPFSRTDGHSFDEKDFILDDQDYLRRSSDLKHPLYMNFIAELFRGRSLMFGLSGNDLLMKLLLKLGNQFARVHSKDRRLGFLIMEPSSFHTYSGQFDELGFLGISMNREDILPFLWKIAAPQLCKKTAL